MIRNLHFTSNSNDNFTFFRMHPEGINKDGKKWRHEEGSFSSNILVCLIKNNTHHFMIWSVYSDVWLTSGLCLAYIGSVLMFRQLLKQNSIFLEDYDLDDNDLKFVEVSNCASHCYYFPWYFVLIGQLVLTYVMVIWLCVYTKFCHIKCSPHYQTVFWRKS
jgi:hypothetical protein